VNILNSNFEVAWHFAAWKTGLHVGSTIVAFVVAFNYFGEINAAGRKTVALGFFTTALYHVYVDYVAALDTAHWTAAPYGFMFLDSLLALEALYVFKTADAASQKKTN
jgi:hypothetical protein